MKEQKSVVYKGIECTLYKFYMAEDDGPLVRIINAKDIDRAYALGFKCVGYPDETELRAAVDFYKSIDQ